MARHSLADWLENASDDTLKSSGLGRKAAGVQNVATDTRKRSVGGKAKAQQPEHNMQVKLISEIRKLALIPEYKDLGKTFAIPNGGKRNVIVAQKMKAEGVRAGIPDLCLPVMRGGYGGMYIELKAGKRHNPAWGQAHCPNRVLHSRSYSKCPTCGKMLSETSNT